MHQITNQAHVPSKICASWLCTYNKHGSVTEREFSFQLTYSLASSFFSFVSNERGTDIADAARQARQGKARQNGGAVGVSDAFSLSLLIFSYSYTCALDNELLLLLIIMMIPNPASSLIWTLAASSGLCVPPVAAAVVMQRDL